MLVAAGVLPRLPGNPGVPCPLRTLTGVPCPMCGMTTSVEDTVRLHLGHAASANPAGIALVAIALVLLAWRPSTLPVPPVAGLAAVLAAMWVFELSRYGFI